MSCKNCNTELPGNFCATCGQKAKTHRIDGAFVSRELQRAFLFRDEGIFFTIKELFSRPGYTIREFIEGKRIKHYKPFYLLISLSGIYIILRALLGVDRLHDTHIDVETKFITNFMWKYYSITNILIIPILSIGSFFAYKKYNYNFAEHFMLNTFLNLQKILINIILLPIFFIIYYFFGINFQNFKILSFLISIIIMYWSYCQFFQDKNKVRSFLLFVLSIFISNIFLIAIIAIALITSEIITQN